VVLAIIAGSVAAWLMMALHDPQRKEELCYSDQKTYVRMDGSEVLFGEDWKQRKAELWERCHRRCEMIEGLTAEQSLSYVDQTREWPRIGYYADVTIGGKVYSRCANEAQDPHHVLKRHPRRDDRLANLLAVCRGCHQKLDPRNR
jgi:hypothetical protein